MIQAETKTMADSIWEEVRKVDIGLFALPNQTVENNCEQIQIEPTKLYVTIRVPAVLAALSDALRPNYTVEMIDRYVVIERVPPTKSKQPYSVVRA